MPNMHLVSLRTIKQNKQLKFLDFDTFCLTHAAYLSGIRYFTRCEIKIKTIAVPSDKLPRQLRRKQKHFSCSGNVSMSSVSIPADTNNDREALIAGVDLLIAPGAVPGSLAAISKNAVVVLAGHETNVLAPLSVATRSGRGRAVAVGHEAFFYSKANLSNQSNAAFARNIATWVSAKPLKGLRIGLVQQHEALRDLLTDSGCLVTVLPTDKLPSILPNLDVVWLLQGSLDNFPNQVKATSLWLSLGGGVVVTGPAWGWKQVTGGDLNTAHSGNLLLSSLGIVFTENYLYGPFRPGGDLDAIQATQALFNLEQHISGDTKLSDASLTQAIRTVTDAVKALPFDDDRIAPQAFLLARRAGGGTFPEPNNPDPRIRPFTMFKAALENYTQLRSKPDQIVAHQSAVLFPGSFPGEARRESRTLNIDTKVSHWHATGLYAVPGEVLTILMPDDAIKKGLTVRIGSHTDKLWNANSCKRFPEVSLSRALDSPTVRVTSAFGGAVFIDVPEESDLGLISVTVYGAIASPHFVYGETSLSEWREHLRNAPAPWAELEGKLVALSLPSDVVRDLNDPAAIMTYWDEMMQYCYKFFAAPLRRPERYCVDVQISAGYMHSGYPIMTHDDVAKRFVDLDALRGPDGNVCWGFYHEMGHNFQRPEWTWDGLEEVTNNLFTLYATEQLNADESGAHPAMKISQREKRVKEVSGAPGRDAYYKRDPWYPLTMFYMLRIEFGWEAFTNVFAAFHSLSIEELPRDDIEKRDQFAVRFSKAVGKNVSQFLESWGVGLSDEAKRQTTELPTWLPQEFTISP